MYQYTGSVNGFPCFLPCLAFYYQISNTSAPGTGSIIDRLDVSVPPSTLTAVNWRKDLGGDVHPTDAFSFSPGGLLPGNDITFDVFETASGMSSGIDDGESGAQIYIYTNATQFSPGNVKISGSVLDGSGAPVRFDPLLEGFGFAPCAPNSSGNSACVTPVPEPNSVWLLFSGLLLGLAGWVRMRLRQIDNADGGAERRKDGGIPSV